MRISSNVPAIIALAAVLSAPSAFAAQPSTAEAPATPSASTSSPAATATSTANTPSAHMPATTTMPSATAAAPATTMAPATTAVTPRTVASGDSTYVTADQRIRASKIVGASVYNDQDQKVGSIDDVLIGKNDDVAGVVLSVGGFLGIDSKLVEVPYKQIQVNNDKLVMSGATKDDLTRLPEYTYKARS